MMVISRIHVVGLHQEGKPCYGVSGMSFEDALAIQVGVAQRTRNGTLVS